MRAPVLAATVAVLLVTGCAAVGAPAAPDVAAPVGPTPSTEPTAAVTPNGVVTVAQPDPVGTWWQAHPEDLAAGDLASLWSLPLYRTDELGRPVPALATATRTSSTATGWSVEVDLASGAWSDGTQVTAADVVATAEALAAARPAAWGAWQGASAVDADTVRLDFDRPFAGFVGLLSEPPGVLPAHVLEADGLAAYDRGLPVTGGWFALAAHEPGVQASFTAHEDGPLGAPGLAGVDVLVVPGHETALGLLADGEVDVVTGHVVLDAPARRTEIPGVEGREVFGGTRIELVWPDGAEDVDVRRAAAGGLDPAPFVEGLLREAGRLPGGITPALEQMGRPDASGAGGSTVVQLARTVEGLGLLARRLQADLAAAGVEASLVRLDPPQHLDPPVATDAHLRLVRVRPDRSVAALSAELGLDTASGLGADAAGHQPVDPMAVGLPTPPALQEFTALLGEDPRLVPLAEVAVTHVWDPSAVTGIRPSAWPGIALWNVGEWTVPNG